MRGVGNAIKVLVFTAAFFMAGLWSCNENGTVTNSESRVSQNYSMNFNSDEFYPLTMNEEITAFVEGDLDQPPALNTQDCFSDRMVACLEGGRSDDGNMLKRDRSKYIFFGEIFRELGLNFRQYKAIRGWMAEYFRCRLNILIATLPERIEIIRNAREKYNSVMNDLRVGVITRGEARIKIQGINQSTREELARLSVQNPYCDCFLQFLDNIRSEMTTEQLIAWDEWIAALEHPCL